jgi:hypothetical protein
MALLLDDCWSRWRTKMENLTLQEIRLVADLRLLHSAANNLLGIIGQIKTRHSQVKVEELADPVALLVTVREVQEATDWLVGLKQHSAS